MPIVYSHLNALALSPVAQGFSEQELRNMPYMNTGYKGAFSLLDILSQISGTILISHSSEGCDSDFVPVEIRYRKRFRMENKYLFSTHLNETDVIFGVEAPLQRAVKEAVERFNPQAVFIRAKCCMAGRSNTEMKEEIADIQRHYSIPILFARCDSLATPSYRRKPLPPDPAWAQVAHLGKRTGTFFNRLNYGRNPGFSNLLDQAPVPWNILEPGASWNHYTESASATASLYYGTVEFGTQWGNMLEREWMVPAQKLVPYGWNGTRSALLETGRLCGGLPAFERIVNAEEAKWHPSLTECRRRLKGKRILPLMVQNWGDEESILCMLRELGVIIPGSAEEQTQWKTYLGEEETVNTFYGEEGLALGSVSGYKLLSLVREIQADVVIVMHNDIACWCARLGIPTLEIRDPRRGLPFQAYSGLVHLGQRLAGLCENPGLFKKLAQCDSFPFRGEWMAQSLLRKQDL